MVVEASKMALTVIIYSPSISILYKLKIVELATMSNVLLISYGYRYGYG